MLLLDSSLCSIWDVVIEMLLFRTEKYCGDLLPKAVRKQNEGCLIEPANNNVDYSCETEVHNQKNWERGNILILSLGMKKKLQIVTGFFAGSFF